MRVVRLHLFPFHREVRAGQLLPSVGAHLREADQAVRAFRAELVAVDVPPAGVACPHRHFHVGLAAAQPDFADQHVVDRNRLILPLDDQRTILRARRQRRKFHHPLAVSVGLGRYFLSCETDGDLLSGLRRTPDGNGHVALQHDIVNENRRRDNLRQERQRNQAHQPQHFP